MTSRRGFIGAGLAALALPRQALAVRQRRYDPWLVYYRDTLPTRAFFDYRLCAFDADKHPPLAPLLDRDITLLGYLSLGEVESYRPDFAGVRDAGYMLMENPNWPGSYFVDIRDKRWTERIVKRLAARVWDQGFHGFFLDTLDNPPHLERTDPVRFKGMTQAANDLVQTLRAAFPKAQIMLNRAYELFEASADKVDFILAESLRARFDAGSKTYVYTPEDEYREHLRQLRGAKGRNPALHIMTLDYWEPADKPGIAKLYALQRANGFLPYVATPALDQVIAEPK